MRIGIKRKLCPFCKRRRFIQSYMGTAACSSRCFETMRFIINSERSAEVWKLREREVEGQRRTT